MDGKGSTLAAVSAALYRHRAGTPRVTRPNTGDRQVTDRDSMANPVLSMRLHCPAIPSSTQKHSTNGAMPPLPNPKRHKCQISILLWTYCPVVMISSMKQTNPSYKCHKTNNITGMIVRIAPVSICHTKQLARYIKSNFQSIETRNAVQQGTIAVGCEESVINICEQCSSSSRSPGQHPCSLQDLKSEQELHATGVWEDDNGMGADRPLDLESTIRNTRTGIQSRRAILMRRLGTRMSDRSSFDFGGSATFTPSFTKAKRAIYPPPQLNDRNYHNRHINLEKSCLRAQEKSPTDTQPCRFSTSGSLRKILFLNHDNSQAAYGQQHPGTTDYSEEKDYVMSQQQQDWQNGTIRLRKRGEKGWVSPIEYICSCEAER
ncbi:hypothetical protein EK904_008910 [Melospiza melodia maxima]|nr:hypothetical protein EK904_008910 [Melospiza melodia maxima]